MEEWFLTAKNSKKKKKNKGKSGPVVQTLTEHAATNNTVEEEEEMSLDKGECTLHHCTSTCLAPSEHHFIDTWRPRQNGLNFADDILKKWIFAKENVWFWNKI